MWLMKRTIVDGWDVDKAMTEATALGLANETLKQFFLDQIRQRKGPRFVPFAAAVTCPTELTLVASCVSPRRRVDRRSLLD
jgi:hypothetical protein